jgi:glycosyltransferase involved in cell wall biosynthesis
VREPTDPNLRVVTLTMGHHAGPSGYHRLADFLGGECIGGRSPGSIERLVATLAGPMVRRSGSLWYHRADFVAELRAARAARARPGLRVHFLYGENSYRYAGALAGAQARLIATFHTPPWRLREVVRSTVHLKRLAAVITMARAQNEFFERQLGPERVWFVPHGVDTDYFTPGAGRSGDRFRFVTVGHHLRDFDALAEVARRVASSHPEAEFTVVAWPDRTGALAGLPNVHCTTGIGDEELRALYQGADALLMPLRDATANNALLEGMACGLPVIATDLEGVRDYVYDGAALYPPGDIDALTDLVQAALERRLPLDTMRAASRNHALTLAWPRVAGQVREVYARIE